MLDGGCPRDAAMTYEEAVVYTLADPDGDQADSGGVVERGRFRGERCRSSLSTPATIDAVRRSCPACWDRLPAPGPLAAEQPDVASDDHHRGKGA